MICITLLSFCSIDNVFFRVLLLSEPVSASIGTRIMLLGLKYLALMYHAYQICPCPQSGNI